MTDNTLYFSNQGEIDITALTTLGVNVKEEDTPIGQFGTGIKYVIAGVLRLGGSLTVWSGRTKFEFSSAPRIVRGKEFWIVQLQEDGDEPSPLGFTTDLGKTWEPWMLYRELMSNALDEQGCVSLHGEPAEGETLIEVTCPEIYSAWQKRKEFWIEDEAPLWQGHGLSVYEGSSNSLFYHNIRATVENSSKTEPWHFRYSLGGTLALTEDRTFASFYDAKAEIGKALSQCDCKEVLEVVLSSDPESGLDYNWWGHEPSKEFVEVVLDKLRRKEKVAASARSMVERAEPEELIRAEQNVPDSLEEMEAQEPEVSKVRASRYEYDNERDERMEGLEAQVAYWKACACKLGGRA